MLDIERPKQAPASLAKKKSYRSRDVLEALYEAFLGKCYLCETPIDLGSFDVDHRQPKSSDQFPQLEYEWTNLFPACAKHRCNLRRSKRWPDGGLLDPGQGHRVELRVVQTLRGPVSISLREAGGAQILFHSADPKDLMAVNTAEELDRIHNDKALAAGVLRQAITDHVFAVGGLVMDYLASLSARIKDPKRVEELRAQIKALVSRRAPYTMLVRSYFAKYECVRVLFD